MNIPRPLISIALSLALAAGLSSAALAQAPGASGSRPVEDPLFGVASVVPESWQALGNGIYARGTPPADPALIAIQSAAVAVDQLWPGLLPQLMLEAVPEPTGSFASATFDWTLYRVDVTLPGVELAVELALAEQDGISYILLLQSTADEFEALREEVLVPALEATMPLEPEPTPDPSTLGYQVEGVTFPGGSEGVELAGTLTLPQGPGPHPVVVMMSGSGPQDRDESLRPITLLKPFAVLADALTSAGVGVLRYDDRGVGGSTGDYDAATIEELASDAGAALDYLETRDDVDPGRLGLFGHSEGGLYAAMLGASDPRVAWIGMMAPAVTDGLSLIVAQNEASPRAEGADEDLVEAYVEFTQAVLPVALEGDVEGVEAMVLDFYGRIWDGLTPDEQTVAGERDAFAQARGAREIAVYTSDWFRSFLAYDPAADWARVRVPVLAVFGGKDVQVLAEQNAAALEAALAAAGNEDLEIITFDDANHLFQAAGTGAFSEYSRLEPVFIDGFVDAVVDWTTRQAGVAA